MRNLFVDIETSGLKIEEGAVPLCVGMLVDDGPEDPNPKHLIVTIKPTEEQWAKASPGALKVNGFTWEKLEAEGVPMGEAISTICDWLAKHNIDRSAVQYIGQNPKFDRNFLRHYMGEPLEWMNFPTEDYELTDVIELAKELAHKDPSVKFVNFKGDSIAEAVGVEPEGALHTALGGILVVRRNYHALIKRLTEKSTKKVHI